MKIKKNIYTCVSALLISTMFSACSFTNQQEITSNAIDNQEVKDIDIDVNTNIDANTSENSEIDINNLANDNFNNNIIYQDDSFILYKNGENNVVDVISQFAQTSIDSIPSEYQNLSILYKHDFSYYPSHYTKITTDNNYASLSKIINDNGNPVITEIEYSIEDYRLRSIVPQKNFFDSVSTSNGHFEAFYKYNEKKQSRKIRAYAFANYISPYYENTTNTEPQEHLLCFYLDDKNSNDIENIINNYLSQNIDSLKDELKVNNIIDTNNTKTLLKEDDKFYYVVFYNTYVNQDFSDTTVQYDNGIVAYIIDKKNPVLLTYIVGWPNSSNNTMNELNSKYYSNEQIIDAIIKTIRVDYE